MVDLDIILAGLSDAFTLWNLCFVIFGVVYWDNSWPRSPASAPLWL